MADTAAPHNRLWNQAAAKRFALYQEENDAMPGHDTKYETGGRIFPAATGPDPSDEFSQDAAKNRKPPHGMGLTESLDETNEKARHSDGQNPREEVRPDSPTTDEP